MENPRDWIHGDETAKEMLSRLAMERPSLLLPPLHRVPLRAGNVVELVGPSPSAKSEVLLQAAISCILPKEWKGVRFGGLERMVVYFDLDCRFDVLRLSQALKHRIMDACGLMCNTYSGSSSKKYDAMVSQISCFDDELFLACMRRFIYIRCYNSFEFLAALKKMIYQSQKEREAIGVAIHFLMIDSIGAFHWIDRACQPLLQVDNKRKNLSFQNFAETIVGEIRKLLEVQPLLVLATKATIFGAGPQSHDAYRATGKRSLEEMAGVRTSRREREKVLYREYMPSAWQAFVTHRIHLGASENTDVIFTDSDHGAFLTYTSQWVQPPLNILDKFTIRDNGIFMMP